MTVGTMHEMNNEGDTKIVWDSDKPEDVALAKAAFDLAKKQGMLAYSAEGREGKKGKQIREFDPQAERIILVKPMAGG